MILGSASARPFLALRSAFAATSIIASGRDIVDAGRAETDVVAARIGLCGCGGVALGEAGSGSGRVSLLLLLLLRGWKGLGGICTRVVALVVELVA